MSIAFLEEVILAMDDPAFLKFCGLNAANPAEPIGAPEREGRERGEKREREVWRGGRAGQGKSACCDE